MFIGNVPLERLPELKNLATRIEAGAFDLMLGKTGWWPHNRIAWAAPNATPAPLQELVSRLQAELRQAGFDFDGRQQYVPHVTLVRNAVCETATMSVPEPFPWSVGEFVLLQSVTGANYQILGRWKLKQGNKNQLFKDLNMSKNSHYGKLLLNDAHLIAGGANSLLMAMQEYAEDAMQTDAESAKLIKKGVDLGDGLLDMARLLVSRGVFSKERYLSEILIYSAAIVDSCEVCALTHIEGAIRAKVPDNIIDTVQAIALYVLAQAEDETYLLFEAYTKHWQRFEEWPRLTGNQFSTLKFYNLIALLMSLVVRKRRLVRLHTHELLTKSDASPEEILEIVGIAQVMGGFPARWEAVHIRDVAYELRETGQLPPSFVAVLDRIPSAPAGR